MTFGYSYSGPNYTTLENYTKTFDPTSDTEMRDCIVLPENYAFNGFSQSLKTSKTGDFIKIYIQSVSSSQYVVSFVGEGYENLYMSLLVEPQTTISFPSNPTFPYEYNDRTFLRWDESPSTIVTGHMFVKAIFSN